MKRVHSRLMMVTAVAAFVTLSFSPLGWPKAYGTLVGKLIGSVCRARFCTAPAQRTVHYTSGKALHYGNAHVHRAPDSMLHQPFYMGLLVFTIAIIAGAAVLLAILWFLGLLIAVFTEHKVDQDKDGTGRKVYSAWEETRAYLFVGTFANFAPWLAALICCLRDHTFPCWPPSTLSSRSAPESLPTS